jgi:putative nucleotidyltransferase-like protein
VRQHQGERVNELTKIASQAGDAGIPFLLAGGHAVITHGFARSTFDLDLIVRRSDREKWLTVAHDLGFQLYREGPAFVQFNHPNADSFPLDLMFVNEETFAKLRRDAVPAPSSAAGVWVVSLMHLLALKCHAVRHGQEGRIVKDAEDVIQLIQQNRLDPEAEAIRDLFQKHGTAEFYEKVRRACRRG